MTAAEYLEMILAAPRGEALVFVVVVIAIGTFVGLGAWKLAELLIITAAWLVEQIALFLIGLVRRRRRRRAFVALRAASDEVEATA